MKTILSIVALILAFPTYGVSLLVLAAYFFLTLGNKFSHIQEAIVQIASREDGYDGLGFAVDNIQYSEVVRYAQGIERIQGVQGKMVSFKTNIGGIDYDVIVNKEPLGSRAIINAKQSERVYYFS